MILFHILVKLYLGSVEVNLVRGRKMYLDVYFFLHCSWISRRPAGRASWGLLQEGFLLLGDYIKFV